MIVSVNGLPGVGKSAVILRMATMLNWQPWTEDPEDFPLVGSATGADSNRVFVNQVDFLVQKMGQAVRMQNSTIPCLVEVDWMTCHIQWSAALRRTARISMDHSTCLDQIYSAALGGGVPGPQRAYYLHAPLDVVISRIESRGRPGETLDIDFLAELERVDLNDLAVTLSCDVPIIDAERTVDDIAASIVADLQAWLP